MEIYFITGNLNKFNEAKLIIHELEQIKFDLPEIQELNAKKIIEEKLNQAIKQFPGKSFFCEDTSLYINSLNNLPGPLIKWFLKSLGDDGIFNLVSQFKDKTAIAKTIIGYNENGKTIFFEGQIRGEIVKSSGERVFGWGKIFQPEGYQKTFGEMDLTEKNKISMRMQALIKLKEYLDSRGMK